MTAIDDLLLDRLDFIKIDIEGMEMDALLGAESSIAAFKPQLLIEKIKSDEGEIRAFVERHGYIVFEAGINLLAVHADDPASNAISIG